MAQEFMIGSTIFNYVTGATWSPPTPAEQALDGTTAQGRTRRHVWTASVMPPAEWAQLRAWEGRACSLTTVDHLNRAGDYRTYPGAILVRLAGRHDGPNFADVMVEWKVRV